MLRNLLIQDVVLIEKLDVPFARGLNVLTGETGAGKSILLDALALALGARGDVSLIRAGATQACVTALFEGAPPKALTALLQEQGLVLEEEDIILRRTITRDGKSRAFINDQPIGVTLLRAIGETLLEIHGQFATQGLLAPATHRALLDAFGGLEPLAQETARAYGLWQESVAAHAQAMAEQARARAEEDFLRASAQELDDLSPREGETDDLAARRTLLQSREKILEALQGAEKALAGEYGAQSSLAQAGKFLARVAGKAPELEALLADLDRLSAEATEAAGRLAAAAQEIDGQGDTLEKIEERLFKLRAVARKHNVEADHLAALQRRFLKRLALLGDASDQLAALAKAAMEARAAYLKSAARLSEGRKKAALKLAQGVMKELPPLKLERAVFTVACETLPEEQAGPSGLDRVAFLAATNAGQEASPLHKAASGGELARFMLALKVVLAKADPVPTLVFDEVDAGIGGATAGAVGERLAALGGDVQVLVVTHSPQVAARGAHHLRVEKQTTARRTTTRVAELAAPEKVEEIARMLAGATVTASARQAALSLIEGATTPPQSTRRPKDAPPRRK